MAAKQVVCDSDVIIDYWDSKNNRHAETKEILEDSMGIDNIVIGGITIMELLRGARNKTELAKIIKSASRFQSILIGHNITLKARSLIQTYWLSHRGYPCLMV
jgi:predicted nucleic acid-binding protein